MKTKEEVLELLLALGATKDEVAEKLVSLGIKGDRHLCATCPIAQYLIASSGGEVMFEVIAGGICFQAYIGVGTKECCSLMRCASERYWYHQSEYPQLTGVREFIFDFDRGEYPQCEI
jgi:hypothetical protein